MGKKRKRQYTIEFKQQAVSLASRIGVSRAAKQLGVNVANVQRWKSESKRGTSKSNDVQVNLEVENRRLQKENDEQKKVIHILRKAAAFFSQDHLK